ncbi:MAG: ABC transporter permease [Clostridium sp.]|uniref:ABC transporter permease n=1 Tax=Clostridium sp. TaxID=1506 RepID=UPI003F307676
MQFNINDFTRVSGDLRKEQNVKIVKKKKSIKGFPIISLGILGIIFLGCIFADLISFDDPFYIYLDSVNVAPNGKFLFGTDTMGRDIFSSIWNGGRISLYIGILATAISSFIGILYGSISGIANEYLDDLMMRFSEILLSIPGILIIMFIQGILGKNNATSIAIVIGTTSWMSIAKMVRTEVRRIRESEYIVCARVMGGGFFYILRRHLLPNFIPAIMYMIVTSVGTAIGTESTLSFLGIGLSADILSWGTMLSLADGALLTNSWWIIVIPGLFLVLTLLSITNLGNYIRKINNKKGNNL